MELIGNLKDKVLKAQSKEEARGLIEKAGMKLTDDELDMVAGGRGVTDINGNEHWGEVYSMFQGFR